MTTRVTDGARRERHPRFALLAASPLPRACIALTKSEEKERLLAIYSVDYSQKNKNNNNNSNCIRYFKFRCKRFQYSRNVLDRSYLFRSLALWTIVSVQRSLLKRLAFIALRLWSFNDFDQPFTDRLTFFRFPFTERLTFLAFRLKNSGTV